jgi:hypothetical protein
MPSWDGCSNRPRTKLAAIIDAMRHPAREAPPLLALRGREKARIKSGLWNGGGPKEDRTPDLRIANAALSQLSYRPICTANSNTGVFTRKSGSYFRQMKRIHSWMGVVPVVMAGGEQGFPSKQAFEDFLDCR